MHACTILFITNVVMNEIEQYFNNKKVELSVQNEA